jgi:hypothetical protein
MQKPKSFRPWQPEQTTLLFEDHQVYFLLDLGTSWISPRF